LNDKEHFGWFDLLPVNEQYFFDDAIDFIYDKRFFFNLKLGFHSNFFQMEEDEVERRARKLAKKERKLAKKLAKVTQTEVEPEPKEKSRAKKRKKEKDGNKKKKRRKKESSGEDVNAVDAVVSVEEQVEEPVKEIAQEPVKPTKKPRTRTASDFMTFDEATVHNEESKYKNSRKPNYEKLFKERKKEFKIDQVKDLKPFLKVSKVKLDSDSRLTSSKWRPGKNEGEDKKDSFNSGMFSIIEREKIEKAIQDYLQEHKLSMDDVPYLIKPKLKTPTGGSNPFTEHRNFSAKIRESAKVNRSIAQVYWFLRKIYSEFRVNGEPRTKWTPKEDQQLLNLIQVKGVGKWSEIERLMGRDGVKERYDCLQSQKLGKWSEEETNELISNAKKIMEREGITDTLKFNQWTEVSALMNGKRTYRECARHWKYLGPQLVKSNKKWEFDDYKDLLMRMIQSFHHANDESEVIWKSIVSMRDPYSVEVYRERWVALRNRMQKDHDMSEFTFKGILS
jgi:hypothetical protein